MIHLNESFYKKCHFRKRENENIKKKNLKKIQSEERNREKKDLNLKEEMNEWYESVGFSGYQNTLNSSIRYVQLPYGTVHRFP